MRASMPAGSPWSERSRSNSRGASRGRCFCWATTTGSSRPLGRGSLVAIEKWVGEAVPAVGGAPGLGSHEGGRVGIGDLGRGVLGLRGHERQSGAVGPAAIGEIAAEVEVVEHAAANAVGGHE